MNPCRTCAHWKPRDQYEAGHSQGLGKCMAAPMLYDATEWGADFEARVLKPEYAETKAFCQDGSDYVAHLLTRPDFGCISHGPAQEGAPK